MSWQNYFFSGIDNSVSEYFHLSAGAFGTEFFSVFTHLGNWRLVAVFAALAVFFFWKYGKKDYIIPFGVVLFGGQLAGSILKRIFARPRPEWGIHAGQFDSFPSGHAIVAVLFYGFLAYLFFKTARRKNIGIIFAVSSAAIILAIGWSRLYLGAHFLSDVIAGYAVGLAWVSIGFWVHRKYFVK